MKTVSFSLSAEAQKNTSDSPSPSCPAARKTFENPGTSPMTGFPSGTKSKDSQAHEHACNFGIILGVHT